MPGITPSHWLPLVVIRVITNLSYTMQRYDFFLIYASILATFFDKILDFSVKKHRILLALNPIESFEVVVAKILAVLRQLMTLQTWQHLLKL